MADNESIKKKVDRKFPEVKLAREMQLNQIAYKLYNESPIGKATTIIYFILAILSIFIFWDVFNLNFILSILCGIITWFVITFVFDPILVKLLGFHKIVRKQNDDAIEASGKNLEEMMGKPIDDLLK